MSVHGFRYCYGTNNNNVIHIHNLGACNQVLCDSRVLVKKSFPDGTKMIRKDVCRKCYHNMSIRLNQMFKHIPDYNPDIEFIKHPMVSFEFKGEITQSEPETNIKITPHKCKTCLRKLPNTNENKIFYCYSCSGFYHRLPCLEYEFDKTHKLFECNLSEDSPICPACFISNENNISLRSVVELTETEAYTSFQETDMFVNSLLHD